MFYGEFSHSLDKKNRLIIPSRFREPIEQRGIERLYVTRGLDKCHFVFAENEWRAHEDKFQDMPFTKREVRQFKRLFFSGAVEVAPDKQWRILVPDYLKEYAGLEKDIMVVGVSNRIEVWDKGKWDSYYDDSKESFEDISERLMDI
jgi:MraZ protein